MKVFFIFMFIFVVSCSKPKSVLICGDHECINKSEARKYFEENLEIEVKIISKKNESRFDLVQMNIKNDNKEIKVIKKENIKVVKKLTKNEIKLKKKEIKKYNEIAKLKKKKININKSENTKDKTIKDSIKPSSVNTFNNRSSDICLKLDKCNIDTITNYLIKNSNNKDYPDITLKE